jgi:ATP/ADP translocase
MLLAGGSVFFAACLTYQWAFAAHAAESLGSAAASLAANTAAAAGVTAGVGGTVLQLLVYAGALLYVFSKSAKFSLFKPAEEMVSLCFAMRLFEPHASPCW